MVALRTLFVLSVVSCLGFTASASAQTVIRVPDDYTTIQYGLNAAAPGDTVLVAAGTYTGPNNRNLNFYGKAVTLRSEAGPEATIIDAEHQGRCFVFINAEGPDTIVDGFTIRDGDALDGGGIYANGASPTILNSIITSCRAERYGGGVYVNSGPVTIDSCTLLTNGAGYRGGGVYGHVVVVNTDFNTNDVDAGYSGIGDGGGAYVNSGSEIKSCRFIANNACRGGALFLASGQIVENSLFVSNTAYTTCGTLNQGGAIYANAASPVIEFATFANNDALDEGHSIYSHSGITGVKHSIVWDSTSNGLVAGTSGSFSVSYSDVRQTIGVFPGTGNLNETPDFVTGPGVAPANAYYLSHTEAGQAEQSPCIDAGQFSSNLSFFCDFGHGADVCMDASTTRTDLVGDSSLIDLGYHHYDPTLFSDGFENGSTDQWTSTTP
jgi:hypothetical protein